MALQQSTSVRNARLDQIETTIGTAPLLRIYTGAAPADCGTAASGTKIVEMTLPSDWLAAASAGSKAKLGTWSSTGITGGTAGYWRIYDSAGTTCHLQGTCGQGSGDMSLDNTSVATSQTVTVTSFSISAGNA